MCDEYKDVFTKYPVVVEKRGLFMSQMKVKTKKIVPRKPNTKYALKETPQEFSRKRRREFEEQKEPGATGPDVIRPTKKVFPTPITEAEYEMKKEKKK